jgi:hypothetical protein
MGIFEETSKWIILGVLPRAENKIPKKIDILHSPVQ